MFRDLALAGAAVLILELASAGQQGVWASESKVHRAVPAHVRTVSAHIVAPRREPALRGVVRRRLLSEIPRPHLSASFVVKASPVPTYQLPAPGIDTTAGAPTSLAYQIPSAAANTPTALSAQESEASRMAYARGDRDFLMVDKALGKIILFENGQPVFSGPALTGASLADQLRPGEMSEKFDNLYALDTKVTPAGRFTVGRGYDKELGGPLLDVSEIRGKDWGIAIHAVYLGTPSEHRDIRIKSPNSRDKHISFGCINVTPEAINYLLREIPADRPFPLYILPEDASQTAAYFDPRTS
jgi:L,D-transpeptidase-like protein